MRAGEEKKTQVNILVNCHDSKTTSVAAGEGQGMPLPNIGSPLVEK